MKIAHVLLLVLLSAGVPALCELKEQPGLQPVAPTQAPRSRFAALDDVRLLANGLLQLGQSLREFVQKTKGQINDIFQKLNIFDRSFNQLSVLTSEIKEEEEELKKTTVVLKASNDEIKGLSVQIVSKVDSILQEKSSLHDKLEGLEEKLSSLSKGLVPRQQAAEINSLRVGRLFLGSKPAPALTIVTLMAESCFSTNYHAGGDLNTKRDTNSTNTPPAFTLIILNYTALWINSPFIFLLEDTLMFNPTNNGFVIPTQEVIHSQETSIRELLRAVTDQSDQLNLQRMKIKTLEEKVNWSEGQCPCWMFEGNSRRSKLLFHEGGSIFSMLVLVFAQLSLLPQLSRKPQETIEKIPEVFSSETPMLSAHQPPLLTSTSELMSKTDHANDFSRASVYSV